jgi:NADPH:quinone reductase-like Zn-dependent oxidoreductase
MKAVVFEEHGGIDVLQYKDIPEPKAGPNDVVIKVRAAACNYNDIWARRGMPGMRVILPHISGSDVAGEVTEVGSEVANVQAGEEVIVHPSISCRTCEACARGEDMFCRQFRIYGFQTGPLDGGHSEYAKVPVYNVIPKPKDLSFEEAASLPLVLLTTWRMLVTRARVRPGDFVLIWGAAGGLGTMAIQICKLHHAHPIAVAKSDEKLEKARELGAEYLINRSSQDVMEEVRKITSRRGVDIVFEHVGEATWETSVQALRWGGTIVICGATTGFEGKTDFRFLWNKQLNFLGSHMGNKGGLLEPIRFVESGDIKPVVSEVMSLQDVGKAQTRMEEGESIGKIVLVP